LFANKLILKAIIFFDFNNKIIKIKVLHYKSDKLLVQACSPMHNFDSLFRNNPDLQLLGNGWNNPAAVGGSNNQVILSRVGIINAPLLVSGLKLCTIIVQLLEEKIMMALKRSFVLLLFMSLIESRFKDKTWRNANF
jgi:hypothetical protein